MLRRYLNFQNRLYRVEKNGLQNIAKQDPGRAGQNRLARAVTKFTKPRTNHYSLPCYCMGRYGTFLLKLFEYWKRRRWYDWCSRSIIHFPFLQDLKLYKEEERIAPLHDCQFLFLLHICCACLLWARWTEYKQRMSRLQKRALQFLTMLFYDTWSNKADVTLLLSYCPNLEVSRSAWRSKSHLDDCQIWELKDELVNCRCTGNLHKAFPRFGDSCCLPLLPQLASSILTTWQRPYRDSLYRIWSTG